MLKEFREFMLRGNLVDLAVAVVIGAAFGAVVAALVKDLITPLIAAIGGKPDFSQLTFTINDSRFLYGDFINALLAFLIVAAVIFYLVIKPVDLLMTAQGRARNRRRNAQLPGVHERDPCSGAALCLLHRADIAPRMSFALYPRRSPGVLLTNGQQHRRSGLTARPATSSSRPSRPERSPPSAASWPPGSHRRCSRSA